MREPYTQVNTNAPKPEFQLSVITVCWNALEDLKPTVESVLRQKAKGSISIEHVVVDGASTDGTPEWLAEQLAAGNIERYVSEPDRGIYDAMNKGINLARGRVLAWLNAGDWYEETEDLAECVLPICRGEAQSVSAWTHFHDNPYQEYFKTALEQMYFRAPCGHPSFFASASLCRKLGGYDSRAFRCSADTDLIYLIIRETGNPLEVPQAVTNYKGGGVSDNCAEDFRDEKIELLWRNRDLIAAKMEADRDFQAAMEAYLAMQCGMFNGWQERHGKQVPEALRKLQQLCRMAAGLAHSVRARLALRALAAACLPVLIRGGSLSKNRQRILRFSRNACYTLPENRYKTYVWLPREPMWRHPAIRTIKKLLGK